MFLITEKVALYNVCNNIFIFDEQNVGWIDIAEKYFFHNQDRK